MLTRLCRAYLVLVVASVTVAFGGWRHAIAQTASDVQGPPPDATRGDLARAYAKAKAGAAAHVGAGRFSEAIAEASVAAETSSALHGAESKETAVALHNLGFVLRRAGRVEKAREVLEKALFIYQQRLPAVHGDMRNILMELGPIYMSSRRGHDLADIYDRLIARAEREGMGDHVGVAHLLASHGFVLRGLRKDEESEAAFTRALGLYEARGEIISLPYLKTLEALLERLDNTQRTSQSETRAKETLKRLTERGSEGVPNSVALYDRLSRATLEAGRGAEAKTYAETALALLAPGVVPAQAGHSDPRIGALNNLARANRALADHAGAEAAYKQAITLLADNGDKANEGIVTDNLAVLYFNLGRLDEAERLNKRALALLEEALGRDHPSVGRAAGNLGALLNEAGRRKDAEPLLRRALAIADAQPRRDAVGIGIIEDNLAGLLRQSGRLEEARAYYERALQRFEGALPAKHPRLATVRNNIGRFLLDSGNYADAETTLVAALSLFEAIYGKDSFNTAIPAANLADVYTARGRYAEARPLLARALAALEGVFGPRHANLLATLNSFGRLELADGKPAAARLYYERAVAAAVDARDRSGIRDSSASAEGRRAFHGLIEALWREGAAGKRDAAKALQAAQLDSMTSTAAALAALGARAGAGDPALGALTRERQDLAAEWVANDKKLTHLLSETGTPAAAQQQAIRARLAAIDERIAAIDAELARRFPRYQELARPTPLSIDALRRLITKNEVAIQFTAAKDATHVFAVTEQGVHWVRTPMTENELAALVRNLRCGLDRAEWNADGGKRCARLLGFDASASVADGDPLPFDLSGANGLYRVLFEPLAEIIAGKDLIVVASGALTSLPLQVLITEPPPPEASFTSNERGNRLTDAASRLDGVAWLGRRHATTVLPSLAGLAPLRQHVRASAGRAPYLGIGNPLLTGPTGTDRRAFDVPACSIAPSVATDAAKPAAIASASAVSKKAFRVPLTASLLRTIGANADELRRQSPLPETAEELCRVATNVRATTGDVVIGKAATEAAVKSMSAEGRLADARVVHFATHGLLAGETALFVADKAEPSLMLTPPDKTSETDDGLLTASEVAALRLDADWVVLSACNTASGDDVGAEALSGLARAFFYAGARSLLVSHWAVDSDATVALITAAFDAMSRERGVSQARALSMAMASMIDRGGRTAHPSNWAPFVVVGGSAPAAGGRSANLQRVVPTVATAPSTRKPKPPRSSARKPRPKAPAADTTNWFDGIFQN